MTATADLLVLEVNPTQPSGNICRNPSARYGMARWESISATPVTPTARGFDMGAGDVATIMLSEPFTMAAGQWTDARYRPVARGSSASPRRVTISARYYTSAGAANGSAVISQLIWRDAQDGGGPVVETAPAARQAPSGTASVRIEVAADVGTNNRLVLADFAIGVAATAAAATIGVAAPAWTPILASGLRVDTESGVEVDGVSETIMPGTLVVTLTDAALDPASSNALGRGGEVRLRRPNGATVWTGNIETADATYNKNGTINITVVATDAGRPLADASVPTLPGGTFFEQVAAACYAAGFGVRDKDLNFVAASTGVASRDDSATAVTWLKRVVATHGGAVYVDTDNRPRVLAAADLGTTPVATFSDTDADALKYDAIGMTYGSASHVNSLTITRINVDEAEDDGSKTYGPYYVPDSENVYGRKSADVEVVGGSAVTIATRLLAPYAVPRRFPSTVTVNALDALDTVLSIRPYSAVRVKRAGLFNEVVRVVKVEHNVVAKKWKTTFHLRPIEVAPTVDLIVPPLGPNTGPSDIVPPLAGPMSLRRRTSSITLANNSETTIPFTSSTVGDGITYSTSTNRWTVPKDGRYGITASLGWSPNATGARALNIYHGNSIVARTRMNGFSGGSNIHDKHAYIKAKAGDQVYVTGNQTSGGDLNINGGDGETFAAITYLGA